MSEHGPLHFVQGDRMAMARMTARLWRQRPAPHFAADPLQKRRHRHDFLLLPRSAHPQRQRENADVFDFTLTEAEIAALSGLERGRLWGGDPDTHEEM